jgi:K+-sensing histidine kinase KdpD
MMMEIYYDFGTSLIALLRSCDEKKLAKIKLKVTELLATYKSHAKQGDEDPSQPHPRLRLRRSTLNVGYRPSCTHDCALSIIVTSQLSRQISTYNNVLLYLLLIKRCVILKFHGTVIIVLLVFLVFLLCLLLLCTLALVISRSGRVFTQVIRLLWAL